MVNRAWYFLIAEVCAAIIRLRAKGGDVIWFKVKSHVGEFRNATADTLAKMVALYYVPGNSTKRGRAASARPHNAHNRESVYLQTFVKYCKIYICKINGRR
jgi:hypothetical protein